MFKYLCHFPLVIAALGALFVPIKICFSKIRMEWMPLVVLAAKCQTAVERNTALQWWCTEAPGRKAGAIKWKIPAEDVFPFLMWRKRVLFEPGRSVENAENTRKMRKWPHWTVRTLANNQLQPTYCALVALLPKQRADLEVTERPTSPRAPCKCGEGEGVSHHGGQGGISTKTCCIRKDCMGWAACPPHTTAFPPRMECSHGAQV